MNPKVALLLVFTASICVAQEQQVTSDQDIARRDLIRREYGADSTMPDYVAFDALTHRLKASNLRNREFAIDLVQQDMDFPSRRDAADFLDRMLTASDAMANESKQIQAQLLCSPNQLSDSNRVAEHFDTLDDLREITSQKHYLLIKSSLDAATADRFLSYLQKVKSGVYVLVSNHKVAYAGAGSDLVTVALKICANAE